MIKRFLPFGAALASFCLVSLTGQYAALFVQGWSFSSWLYPLLFTAALESSYFAAYFLTPQVPLLGRVLELSLFLSPLYFLSAGSKALAVESLLVGGAWLLARGYGRQFAEMEIKSAYLSDYPPSAINWEYESLESKGYGAGPAVEYFWRRFFAFGSGAVVLAIIAERSNFVLDSLTRVRLGVLTTGSLFCLLVLQTGAYLFRLQILWEYAQAKIQPGLSRIWLKSLSVFLVVALLAVNAAPVNYSPFSLEKIGPRLAGFLQRILEGPALKREAGSDFPAAAGGPGFLPPPSEAEPSWWIAVILLIYLLSAGGIVLIFFLILLGFLIVEFSKKELGGLRGLPKLAVRVFKALKRVWQKLTGAAWAEPEENVFSPRPAGVKEEFLFSRLRFSSWPEPRNIRAQFRRMVRLGRKKGVSFRADHTAGEYGFCLQKKLKEGKNNIALFIAGYHRVRYGRDRLGPNEQSKIMALGSDLIKEIKNLGKEE
ncbi:MAG: hypothetical protein GX335_02505 [Firmicutes bacterium]|nr:hypothetical protein [Bacillota bacterium]